MTPADLLLQFDREMATTRRLLERIPADKMEWRPHPKSATMAGIGRHLAHMLTWGILALTVRESDASDRTLPGPTPAPEDILRMFDGNVAALRTLLAAQSDADLALTWTLTYQGKALKASTREAVIQSMVLSHAIHHRGQLSVYLRLNDIPVPSIYGPSADEPGV